MADMSLDELLSSSIKSAAEPAASTGVADAIRARVAAGDAGTSVAGSTAPGWVGGAARPAWFLPLVGAIVGLTAALVILIAVLVWPSDPTPVATVDVVTPTPSPTPTPTQTPTPTPTPTPTEEAPPPPPRDRTSPVIRAGKWSSPDVYPTGFNCTPTTADIVITATDETRLADVTASTSVPGTTAAFVGFSGSAYTFRFSGNTGGSGDIQVNVTFTAVDEAGNTANVSQPILFHQECIIIG